MIFFLLAFLGINSVTTMSFQDCMMIPCSASTDELGQGCRNHDYNNDGEVNIADYAIWQRLSPYRTAKNADSWLVLYNKNSKESIEWAEWYSQLHKIPNENLLGLNASLEERICVEEFLSQIYYPILEKTNDKIMGIIVGFLVPGNFYLPSPWSAGEIIPPTPEGSGYSVTSALMNMSYISGPIKYTVPETNYYQWKTYPTYPNPHFFDVDYETPSNGVTKFSLGARRFLTARIDGPSLKDVKKLSDPIFLNKTRYLYYDNIDESYGEWASLDSALNKFVDLQWIEFNSDIEDTPDCLIRFSWSRISAWRDVVWDGSGTRLLAFDQNSFGATTIRSLIDHNGRFVPNILFKANFKVAIGATAEPLINTSPDISTLIYHILEGRNLGESMFLSVAFTNWMWELVGDPLLSLE
jgi:uncharacterized protein (TIGR03790 family)